MKRFDRWLFAPLPAARLASVRILVGGFATSYLILFGLEILAPLSFEPHRFRPIGIWHLWPEPLPSAALVALYGAALPLALAFTSGFRYRWSGPAFAGVLLVVSTYRNSWGMVFHTENLMVLHVLLLALAPAADAWSLDHRERSTGSEDGRHGWALRAMCLVTVSTYLVAGVTKLRISGWGWTEGEVLRAHVALDTLQKIELGSFYSFIAPWLVQFGAVFTPLAALTLAVELGAPVALLGRRAAAAWVGAVWAFHVGVGLVMAIGFAYPLTGVAFASFFEVEAWWDRVRGRTG